MPDSQPTPTPRAGATPGKWGDLGTRIASAVVLVLIAGIALFTSPVLFSYLVLLVLVLAFWELAALCEPGVALWRRVALAAIPAFDFFVWAGVNVSSVGLLQNAEIGLIAPLSLLYNLAPVLVGLVLLREGRLIWLGYATLLGIARFGFHVTHFEFGPWGVAALVALVALSDIFGYFVGRAIGGPKFWPRISPKKTWSGTIAGWVAAGLFAALVFPILVERMWVEDDAVRFGHIANVAGAAFAGALIAFVGQMGDIAASAMKRRVGVKDASNLIPGHGGVLDRFDALVAAAALVGAYVYISVLVGS